MTNRLALTLALLTSVTACGAPDAPEHPSWDIDVYPILRGSCLHCHGASAATSTNSAAWRFDVCNPADFAEAGTRTDALFGALTHAELIAASIEPGHGRARMPPPPAAPLSDYEVAVLRNWTRIAVEAKAAVPPMPRLACRKQQPNREPVAYPVGAPRPDPADPSVVLLTVEIADPDGDEVLGKASAGSASMHVMSAGRQTLRLAGARAGDAITITLSDGYVTTPPLLLTTL